MKKFVAYVLFTSIFIQHVALAEISIENVNNLSGTGTLSERAYLYRSTQTQEESYANRAAKDPQFFEKLPKKMENFNNVYAKHLEFEEDAIFARDIQVGDVQLKKDLTNLVKRGIDTGLSYVPTKTPFTAIAMPMVNYLKEQAFSAANKHFDDEMVKITEKSKQLVAWDFLRKVSKVANIDKLSFDEAQNLYKQTMGESALLLDKGLRSKMTQLSSDKGVLALYAGTQQFVMGTLKQFASIKEAQTELNKKVDEYFKEERDQKAIEAREFLEGKALMAQYQKSIVDETIKTRDILFEAQKSYMNSKSATGALLAQGLMTHVKLDKILGNTDFLVAQAVKNMSARELLESIKNPASPIELRNLSKDTDKMTAIRLQAQKERMAEMAQDIQIVGNAMVDAGLALGMDQDAARALQAGVGVAAGIVALAAATGPVGYVVAVVTIICSIAGLFGRGGDNGMQQLMDFMQQLAKQVEEIKYQLFVLKVVVTRQHAEMMQKLDMEFGKTKDGLEKLLKIEGLKEFETRYGSCMDLERGFHKWIQNSPKRFNLSDEQYRQFFNSDEEYGKQFKDCLSAIDKIAAIDDVQSTSDYFYIYHFNGQENNPDVQFSRIDSYKRLWNYYQGIIRTLPIATKLSPSQLDALCLKILAYIPKTQGWESFKNRNLNYFRTDDLGITKELQVFQRGLISSSAVYYYVKTLGFLSQFAPYVDQRGKVVDLTERLKDTTPGQKYFPDSATSRVADLLNFVKPFLTAAIAQENLFSGAVVAESLAKDYVNIEAHASKDSQRYNSQENDVGIRFSDQGLVSANATISQNFLAQVLKYQNSEFPTSALKKFNEKLNEGKLSEASMFLPRNMALITHDERMLNSLIGLKSAQILRLDQDIGIIKGDPKGIGDRQLELMRKETEKKRLATDKENIQSELEKLKKNGIDESLGKTLYFTLPTSLTGDKQVAQIQVSEELDNVIRFKRTERLEQLISMRDQLIELNFDYNWNSDNTTNSIRTIEDAVEALQ